MNPREYLSSKGLQYKEKGNEIVTTCPFCGRSDHLYMTPDSGAWICHRCGRSGSFRELQEELGDRMAAVHLTHTNGFQTPVSRGQNIPSWEEYDRWHRAIFGSDPAAVAALQYLTKDRHFTIEAIKGAKIGITARWGKTWLTIPYLDFNDNILGAKLRTIPPAGRAFARLEGGTSQLYRQSTIQGKKEVTITEGEIDAISLHFVYGFQNVCSTSLGARNYNKDWLEALQDAERIYLCYDNDSSGDQGAANMARKLGTARCLRVRLPKKDVNECLKAGITKDQLQQCFTSASPVIGPTVQQLGNVGNTMMEDDGVGEPLPWQPLTSLIGGSRRGELIIITGRTGMGKSTFLVNCGYRLALEHSPVVLFPSEQRPADVFRKAASSWLGMPWHEATEQYRQAAIDALSEIPMYVVDHYGQVEPGDLKDVLSWCVERYGARHLMMDHLHFFWPIENDQTENSDIGKGIRAIKTWGMEMGTTNWLVIQPRKGEGPVTASDLRGTVELSQTPDVIMDVAQMVIKDGGSGARVNVTKCRHEAGGRGKVDLAFHKPSQSYLDIQEVSV